MKNITSLLCFFLFAHCVSGQQPTAPSFVKDSLDEYVERALKEWKIPGVSVCVVKDGNAVVMKGYGVKELETNNKVDENTLFMIGSNTKAFTATALAMLDAEKKLSLDDKVQKWLPDFRLYDPWVTKEATIGDLLCHRLGFETFQGDFMFFDSDLSTAEMREKFGRLKPLYSFRGKWGYTNAAFMTAGEIFPKATGKTWAEYLKERIFLPLNKWILMQLNNGKFGDKEIVPALGGNRFLSTWNDPLYGVKVLPFTIENARPDDPVGRGKVRSLTVRVADFVEFTPYEFIKAK